MGAKSSCTFGNGQPRRFPRGPGHATAPATRPRPRGYGGSGDDHFVIRRAVGGHQAPGVFGRGLLEPLHRARNAGKAPPRILVAGQADVLAIAQSAWPKPSSWPFCETKSAGSWNFKKWRNSFSARSGSPTGHTCGRRSAVAEPEAVVLEALTCCSISLSARRFMLIKLWTR